MFGKLKPKSLPPYPSTCPSFTNKLRAYKETHHYDYANYESWDWTTMDEVPFNQAGLISSQVRDSDRHIVALDIDLPATVENIDGWYEVTIDRAVSARQARSVLDAFVLLGLVHRQDASITLQRIPTGLFQKAPTLNIPFSVPVELLPSKTLGNFHLFIDHELTWEQLMALLKALKKAKVLESAWVKATIRSKRIYMKI